MRATTVKQERQRDQGERRAPCPLLRALAKLSLALP